MSISNISDTARWVAIYRAQETERVDSHFKDPFARALAGPKGEEIVRTLKSGQQVANALIVRTCVLDEFITDLVKSGKVDTVLNLAAGLDARPYRMELPENLNWIEIDLPEMVAYKTEKLSAYAPRCKLERIAMDLRDQEARRRVFSRINSSARGVLIITEGLLIYLREDDVASLSRDLAAQSAFRWWIQDYSSPFLMKYLNRRWGKTLRAGNSPFQFAPAEGPDYFGRFGWKTTINKYAPEEARRLKREVGGWFWKILSVLQSPAQKEKMKRISGFSMLEKTNLA